ncbi:unnamed protein product [Didymodactylos carnosus]|uniref:Reverse transcriptase domain-containing protein n=1 Tax=Didymodactylos carnosus TaxID=1234261 RepID=A0A814LSB1_9BILA|nr:unnamed protein product [Didymodactylos carnosus]CAF3836458.1 unnamed protein product [Didymodactylos carnosus]
MRQAHTREYNETIEVASTQPKWSEDEARLLAEKEAALPANTKFINKTLAAGSSRSIQAISSKRATVHYNALLAEVRREIAGEAQIARALGSASNGQESSELLHSSNLAAEMPTRYSWTSNRESNASDVDQAKCPDIKQYVKDNILGVGEHIVNISDGMLDALVEFADYDMEGKNPVQQSLEALMLTIGNVPCSQQQGAALRNTDAREFIPRIRRKRQRYAHYQYLYKHDRPNLAAELFDGVNSTAECPTIGVAYKHFKNVWSGVTRDNGAFVRGKEVGADILLAPITLEDITWALKNTPKDTAKGPDQLPLWKLKKIKTHELWAAMNVWLGLRRVPASLKLNRTKLLPKGTAQLDNIKNWRPITIASILICLFNKILANRMSKVFQTDARQRGFKPLNGAGQNIAMLHHLIRHARTHKRDLYVCLLDVSKAFDSVPHDSVIRALMRKGAPDEFIKLVKNQYMGAFTSLSYADKSSLLTKLKRGVKQGDPSSILFNLVLDELFELLGDRLGYNIEEGGRANAMAFADDLALASGSKIGLQSVLNTTVDFQREG